MSESIAADALAVANEAKSIALSVKSDQEGHEDLCAERYGNIHKTLGLILKILGWGGATMALMMATILGWSLNQQVSTNHAQVETLTTEIQILRDRNVAPPATR